MDDIPRPAVIQDHRDGTARKGFKDHPPATLAERRKHHHICRPQAPEDLRMPEPTTEVDGLLDSQELHQLLEIIPLRAIADNGEPGQTVPQNRRSRAQTDVTSFPANQAAHKNQFKFCAGIRTARVSDAKGSRNAILRDKKQLLAMRGKLSTHVGRCGYDGRGVAIGGPGKRQKPVQIPESEVYPLPLLVRLAKAWRGSQTTIERPHHEGYRPLAQEESERTRQHWRHRQDTQNDIELARKNAAPQLPPGVPFPRDRKRIAESGQRLRVKVRFEDLAETPVLNSLEHAHPNHLDGSKRRLCSAHIILGGRSNYQSDIMELRKCCRMTITNIRDADALRIARRCQHQEPQTAHKFSL